MRHSLIRLSSTILALLPSVLMAQGNPQPTLLLQPLVPRIQLRTQTRTPGRGPPAGASGLGRLLQTNTSSSLARNYSCPTYQNMCGATFGPDNFLDAVYNTDSFFGSIVVEACTEYSPNSCGQTQPSGQEISFSTQWSGNYSSFNRTDYSTSTQLELYGTDPGTFNLSATVLTPQCQSAPLGGGGTVRFPARSSVVRSTYTGFYNCGANATRHDQYLYPQVVDQNGTPFTQNAIAIGEIVTPTQRDVFHWGNGTETGSGQTSHDATSGKDGVYLDLLFNCDVVVSRCLDGTGANLKSDLTQTIQWNGLASSSFNVLEETCSGITINGQK